MSVQMGHLLRLDLSQKIAKIQIIRVACKNNARKNNGGPLMDRHTRKQNRYCERKPFDCLGEGQGNLRDSLKPVLLQAFSKYDEAR